MLFDEQIFSFADVYNRFHKPTDSPLLSSWRTVNLTSDSAASEEVETLGVEEELLSCSMNIPSVIIPAPVAAPKPQSPVQHNESPPQSSNSRGSQSDASDQSPEVQAPVVQPTHSMTTRARSGIVKPNPKYALVTVKSEHLEPKSVKAALKDPGWNDAMGFEIGNMEETETFELVPPEEGHNSLSCGWIYKEKLNADGTVLKLRAQLVARGNEHEEGVGFLETFSPVVRTATIRMVLHVAVTKKWSIKQLDVQNAFLHDDLKESVFMTQPPGFIDASRPDHVWKLKKAIYGLKQAPRAWFDKFSTFLLEFGFECSFPDPSLFVYHKGNDVIYLLLYVDDMILTGNNDSLLQRLIEELSVVFRMKDMGTVHYFLGIQVHQCENGLFLNQSKYAQDLLTNAGMRDCPPMPTPLPLMLDNLLGHDELFPEPSYFRSLAGKLQYLTLTRPDLQFSVNYICQKMQ